MSLRNLFVLVALLLFALPSPVLSQDEADAVEPTGSAEDDVRESNRNATSISQMFASLDTNSDKRLAGEELTRLPGLLKVHFLQGRDLRSVVIDIDQFRDGVEEFKKNAAGRPVRDRVPTEVVGDQRDRTRFFPRAATDASDDEKATPDSNAPVRRLRQPASRPDAVAQKSVRVEIVMLRRTSDGLPERTLASEVTTVLDGNAPSLSSRVLAWLADPDSGETSLVDYIQAQSIDGQSVVVQRGGNQPYVSGTTSMGSRGRAVSYNMQQVGTLVRIEPAAMKDNDKLSLSVQFEKSYLEQAAGADDEEEAEEQEAVDEQAGGDDNPAGTPANSAARTGRSPSPFARSPAVEPVPPPTIATITVEGKLVLPAGEAGVLTEIAKQNGDLFEEVVLLVQWN